MSENYPSDVKLDENQDGTVSFATDVVATIAGLAATEVEGVASMSNASASSGFADMFSRKSTRNFTKGVHIDLEGNSVTVDVSITVEYGSPVPDVARGIQENVKKAIETMSGLEVRSVDVHVNSVSFEREQRAAAELDEQQKKFLQKSEEEAEEAEEDPSEQEDWDAEDADPEADADAPEADEELPAEDEEQPEEE